MVNDRIQRSGHLYPLLGRKAALEHGQLQPLPVAFHRSENPAPAAAAGDVVGHDKQPFVNASPRLVALSAADIVDNP